MEDGGNVLMLAHSHQDPSCRVLYVLKPLQALARDPDEECVTVVQSGGDKGMNLFFRSLRGREWGGVWKCCGGDRRRSCRGG